MAQRVIKGFDEAINRLVFCCFFVHQRQTFTRKLSPFYLFVFHLSSFISYQRKPNDSQTSIKILYNLLLSGLEEKAIVSTQHSERGMKKGPVLV